MGYLPGDDKLGLFQQVTNVLRGTRLMRFAADFKRTEDPFDFADLSRRIPVMFFTLGDIDNE